MKSSLAIVGDFKPDNRSHQATNDAIQHSAAAGGLDVASTWIGTNELFGPGASQRLAAYDGIWLAPASPYQSMDGALSAIRFARERRIPLLGTCGGFQHIILEYARNVLGFAHAQHEETSPEAAPMFISRLACSLVGRTMTISLAPASLIARACGRLQIQEQYICNFGVNPDYVDTLRKSALRIVASDEEGQVRAVELSGHAFFVGTLFLPQHHSTPAAPHPLVTAFLRAVSASSGRTQPH
jgi:CTP synthase (UTP-ammonia lyase)